MMNDRFWHDIQFKSIGNYFLTKGWVYALLIAGLYIFYKLVLRSGMNIFLGFSLIPLAITGIMLLLKYSKQGFYSLFCLQFALMLVNMQVEIKLGVATLGLTLLLMIFLIVYNTYERLSWTESRNGMLGLYLIWGIYCIAQIANPNNVQEAWNIMITHYLVYPVICAVLLPFAIRSIKDIQWLLIIWSIFILIASAKGYWQKTHGFNDKEMYFLFEYGAARTHIIWSGIRYFSLFTDAANFGVHMAMGVATFGISLFYVKSWAMKIYFGIVILAAIYGMGISGTRAAVVVPIGAIGLYIILSRNWKACIAGTMILSIIVAFFIFTDVGDNNQYIRKMRSAFRPTEDASYMVRVGNREKMKELMLYKPFGYGQGLSKPDRFHPKEMMPYPPDSWLVAVWVENGIIGLVLYLLIHGVLFAWCSWILIFKIRNKQLRGLLTAWLCMNAGYFVAAYVNDVMQYPNSIVIYTGFALCFAGPYIEKRMTKKEQQDKQQEIT